jgi:hypothetical protein
MYNTEPPQELEELSLQSDGYGLDGPGSIPGNVRFFSCPKHPDRLWGPPSPLSNGTFLGDKAAGACS